MARLIGALILAIETSCDDTCAAVLDGPRILANVISSQAEAHARFGGVVPEVASRHHLELAMPVVEAALAEADAALDDVDAVAVTVGPGPDRRPAGRGQHREGARRAAAAAADPRRPPPGPRRRQLPRARAARAAVPLPGRERRPHAARRGARPRRPRGARPDPRRRRRRGLRQGRADARPRLSRAARRSSGSPREGDPEAFELPGRDEPRPRPRLQLQRPEDGARLPLPRPRPGRGRASAAPTSRRASRPRRSAS